MTDKPKLDPNVTLFATDEELVELLAMVGVPKKHAKEAIQELSRNPYSGFPPKQRLWGDRRSWPDVREYVRKPLTRPAKQRESA